MQRLLQLIRYLKYYFTSTNEHGVHSPFVFDLVTNVIYSDKTYYPFAKIEHLRKKNERDDQVIRITDFGAGSQFTASSDRKVSAIAQQSAKREKYAKLLFRLANRFRPETIIELGTSLGFSTLYLAAACKKSRVITIEGCPEIASIAQQNFTAFNCKNIKLVNGEFTRVLELELKALSKLDFVFFDGNHQYQPTLDYFHECLKKAHQQSIFIFDDIHWSKGMEQAWKEIKNHPMVSVSIDLFFMGIVFFHSTQAKEHFVIRY